MEMTNKQTVQYTHEEINNIVYICLKWGCNGLCERVEAARNDDIEELVIRIGDNHSTENIVAQVLDFVKRVSGVLFVDMNYSSRAQKLHELINFFNTLPYTVRADLGKDNGYIQNKTKH